jgi:hypothetical protein
MLTTSVTNYTHIPETPGPVKGSKKGSKKSQMFSEIFKGDA